MKTVAKDGNKFSFNLWEVLHMFKVVVILTM